MVQWAPDNILMRVWGQNTKALGVEATWWSSWLRSKIGRGPGRTRAGRNCERQMLLRREWSPFLSSREINFKKLLSRYPLQGKESKSVVLKDYQPQKGPDQITQRFLLHFGDPRKDLGTVRTSLKSPLRGIPQISWHLPTLQKGKGCWAINRNTRLTGSF